MSWIDINNDVPNIGQKVIGYRPTASTFGDDIITILTYTGQMDIDLNGNVHYFERAHYVSHWMPIPEAPAL